jgi:hypothetical protein
MQNKYVRARWISTELAEELDPLDHQVTIDLMIDRDTEMAVGKQFCMGLYGSPVRDYLYPFILKRDGTVDYGQWCSEAGQEDRLQNFNALSRPIRIGEIATFRDSDCDWVMRLVQIQELC